MSAAWWWLVWTLLVLGTLVGAFFLGRSLWRRAVALGREVARASEQTARLGELADEYAAAARERNPVPPVALGREPAELRVRLAGVRAGRDRRRQERAARHREAWAGWSAHWR